MCHKHDQVYLSTMIAIKALKFTQKQINEHIWKKFDTYVEFTIVQICFPKTRYIAQNSDDLKFRNSKRQKTQKQFF